MSQSPEAPHARRQKPRFAVALGVVLLAGFAQALHWAEMLADPEHSLAAALFGPATARDVGDLLAPGGNTPRVWVLAGTLALGTWLLGAGIVGAMRRRGRASPHPNPPPREGRELPPSGAYRAALASWGLAFGWWLLAPAAHLLFEVVSAIGGGEPDGWAMLLGPAIGLWESLGIAAWLATGMALSVRGERRETRDMSQVARSTLDSRLSTIAKPEVLLFAAIALFIAVSGTLNVLQYRALMVPHGDSAMYEEHLWNLLHGKGFRSQLDGGRLFLGEHPQVLHVLLVPIYVLRPSLPTLMWCETAALALGALPVFWMARRAGRVGRAPWSMAGARRWPALALALAYLLYFPVQYLDLELSLKAFRPETFGVPLLLFALDALDRGRYRTMLVLLAVTLLAKEDYAAPIFLLGLYLAVLGRRPAGEAPGVAPRRKLLLLGAAISAAALLYAALAVFVFIPHFRGGEPHYVEYFRWLGATPSEIARNVLTDPGLLLGKVFRGDTGFLVLSLLVPLAGLPLLAPARLAVGLPTFLVLCLIQLPGGDDAVFRFHPLSFHFHAPLVPGVFWAAAGGLGTLSGRRHRRDEGRRLEGSGFGVQGTADPTTEARVARRRRRVTFGALAALFAALLSGFWYGKSPLSLAFWDPHRGLNGYWRALYVPGERADRFEEVAARVPQEASVASTDYIHARFTHHAAAHDFPLRPHVSADEVDYLAIDLRGPYASAVLPQDADLAGQRVLYGGPRYLVLQRYVIDRDDPRNLGRVPRAFLHADGVFESVYEDDYFLLLRRRQ